MSQPTYPPCDTLVGRALAMLIEGKRITHLDFWRAVGSYRLSEPIRNLRKRGWQIQSVDVDVPTSDPTKRRAKVSEYFLTIDTLRQAGDPALVYVGDVRSWEAKMKTGTVGAVPASNASHQFNNDFGNYKVGRPA